MAAYSLLFHSNRFNHIEKIELELVESGWLVSYMTVVKKRSDQLGEPGLFKALDIAEVSYPADLKYVMLRVHELSRSKNQADVQQMIDEVGIWITETEQRKPKFV